MVRVVGDGADPHAAARDSGCSALLCFWRRSLKHQLAARSPGHPAPHHCRPCPPPGQTSLDLGRARSHVARVRWSTHRLPARSIWFRPMEHTPCSYSSILVEFISRYFKYSLYVF
jgi:hypothetical protein